MRVEASGLQVSSQSVIHTSVLLECGLIAFGRTPGAGLSSWISSPKRNRSGQCLLGSEQSQNGVLFSAIFRLKALISKVLIDSYAASQALMPKRCNVLLETAKESPPLQVLEKNGDGLCHDRTVSRRLRSIWPCKTLWERACSRRRHVSHYLSALNDRFREQARSHNGGAFRPCDIGATVSHSLRG